MLSNPNASTIRPAADSGPRWAAVRRATREWSPGARISLRSMIRAALRRKKADRA
jgi:hypothetical protein